MSEENMTKEELIKELRKLRSRIAQLEAHDQAITPTVDQDQEVPIEPLQNGDSLHEEPEPPRLSLVGREPTETIDLSTLFTTDVTDSGSFDIRGDIWATTFGKVIQALPIAALLVDRTTNINVANEAWRRITPKYSDIVGSAFADIFPSPVAAKKAASLILTVFDDRKPRVVEAVLTIEDQKIWARMTFRSIRIMQDQFVLVLVEDLTPEKEQLHLNQKAQEALKKSEARFKHIYNNAPLMMHSLDRNGIVKSVNAKWFQEMGYTYQEVIGKSIDFMLTKESRSEMASFIKMLWTKGELHDIPQKYVKKDGTIIAVRVDSVTTEDPALGAVSLCTSRDVTHELMLEKQLREAQKMEAVATLAGGIAHDFNNLLQIMLGYADLLLLKEDKTSPSHQGLRAIRETAKRGSDLVKQLLTFSRRVETNPRPLDLNHQVTQATDLLRRTIPKMIDIELQLAEDVQTVYADPAQIEQVILNLALNAKDAMPEGGRLVFTTKNAYLGEEYCKAFPEVQPGEYVLLSIMDTGQGIEKDLLDHIFEPFYTTKKPGEGTGLGLSIVFGIVKMHGGHITCSTQTGKGTTFDVYLPAIGEELGVEMETTAQMPAFGTETILLVDDEELVRNWGEELLTQVGYTVITAANGKEALVAYKASQAAISLVVLDLIMPEMGGKQCIVELLKLNPELRILVSSGYPIDSETRKFLEVSAKGIVPKPFKVKDLLQAVRSTLDEP